MSRIDRRQFLAMAGLTFAGLSTGALRAQSVAAPEFSFLFLTDTHIQPELGAEEGVRMAFRKASAIDADFALHGGDVVLDATSVDRDRMAQLFDMYGAASRLYNKPLHHALGNHDVAGVVKGTIQPNDPFYARGLFESRFGKTYRSFDHKGVHFIILDSIGFGADHIYQGVVDAAQLEWLRRDLESLRPDARIVVVSHIPLATQAILLLKRDSPDLTRLQVGNAEDVWRLLKGRKVIGVLQGHLHYNERLTHEGVPVLTSGAVCGSWWHGAHHGSPEGFTVIDVRGDKLTARYETYGFVAQQPAKKSA